MSKHDHKLPRKTLCRISASFSATISVLAWAFAGGEAEEVLAPSCAVFPKLFLRCLLRVLGQKQWPSISLAALSQFYASFKANAHSKIGIDFKMRCTESIAADIINCCWQYCWHLFLSKIFIKHKWHCKWTIQKVLLPQSASWLTAGVRSSGWLVKAATNLLFKRSSCHQVPKMNW